ncbi:Histamine H1 receptor [Portunus trituberculatus]|uniref:Histamine H1 receptor n=1 Tax=Portunus trituberculatus TaxID=210409 RepID=A0A5B7EYK3_PORTR|nr:Histamine H1 receptor [Portunus trituberculatus]
MGPPSSIVAEIDTTPFKSVDDSSNGTKGFKYSYAVYPKYLPPLDTAHASTPRGHAREVEYGIEEGGSGGLIEFRVATTVSWDAAVSRWSDAPPWSTASSWNLSLGEPNHNVTLYEEGEGGSGWWADGAGRGADEWSPGLLAITGLALYTLALCTAVGNALVIHAIRTEKRLQTVSNLFIMSLAAADLTVGVIVMPISAAYAMMGEWRLGLAVCQFWLAADYTASTASIFNLVILSLDRYWSITAPLRYLRRRTRRRAWVMIGASWTAATAWLVPVLAWHHLALGGVRHHPPHVCETEFSNSAAFKAVTAALNFYLPTALMLYLYCRIFREVQTRQALGRVPFTTHDIPTDSCSEAERGGSRPPPSARNAQFSSSHLPAITTSPPNTTITTPTTTTTTTTTSGERSQFCSLTVVSPGRHDCSYFSGVVVSVEYLPEDSGHTSPTQQYFYSQHFPQQQQQQGSQQSSLGSQQSSQQQSLRRQMNNNRLGPHQNHIHCYQSSTRPHPTWDPSASSLQRPREQKWNSSWRLGSLDNSGQHSSAHASSTSSNGTRKKRAAGGGSGGAGRRVESSVNLVKERKAARQLGVIVGAFMACWVPYFTLFLIMAMCETCVPAHVHTATIWLGYLNSALNPVLYPLCNHNFRRAFARMLRLPPRKPPTQPNAHRLPTIAARH